MPKIKNIYIKNIKIIYKKGPWFLDLKIFFQPKTVYCAVTRLEGAELGILVCEG
jgi:hypothetical protein